MKHTMKLTQRQRNILSEVELKQINQSNGGGSIPAWVKRRREKLNSQKNDK